nr:unnamed protein product [Callosobruchus analis]
MVMVSFKIDKQLQTISNYFLFSLAVADFAIGLISMPLFTIYTLLGYWPLGPIVCDTWLALDYLASNASVLNLLIISFDRYFSVTRPLTYRAKRTTTRAAVMIACAWGISLLLWPPWIYSWPYIEGQRTVPNDECYIQFIETNHYITFGTAIAAFYVPVSVMCFLYWRIWRETEKRQKDLPNLQAGKKDSSKRSNSSVFVCSDEANNACSVADPEVDWRRPRSESSTGADTDSVYMHGSVCVEHYRKKRPIILMGDRMHHRRSFGGPLGGLWRIQAWCVAWWHSGREDASDTEEESPSEQGHGCVTPVSLDTPLQSTVSRCTSMNVMRDPYISAGVGGSNAHHVQSSPQRMAARDTRSLPAATRLQTGVGAPTTVATPGGRSLSSDSVYTILIRLPPPSNETGGVNATSGAGQTEGASIKMIPEITRNHVDGSTDYILQNQTNYHLNRRPSAMPDIRIPLNAKIIPKQLASGGKQLVSANASSGSNVVAVKNPVKRRKRHKRKRRTKRPPRRCQPSC